MFLDSILSNISQTAKILKHFCYNLGSLTSVVHVNVIFAVLPGPQCMPVPAGGLTVCGALWPLVLPVLTPTVHKPVTHPGPGETLPVIAAEEIHVTQL